MAGRKIERMIDSVAGSVRSTVIPELVALPGGTFLMGNDGGRKDERPAHPVQVSPLWAARHPVTNQEYAASLLATGSAPPPWFAAEGFDDPEQPVVGVNWFEAVAYCDWLTHQTGIPFRLPTEAEREFAALGGLVDTEWPWSGSNHPIAAELATLGRPHRPQPGCENGYGLRCMGENVHEWCSDWYGIDYYSASPIGLPTGPASGVRRASRGGAWRHAIKFTRVAARSSLPPGYRYNDYGFRVYADA